ncbi:MAG: TAXI family TRAP transporter solute-binding subunit [Vicinamibacterales bacterium]|jgi:TRAP transporter TAXI family solute receptor|nr:TAXI family TRAP transporter solute-binding subunit [Vicinamibacterales bacterium]MDP7670564.1 TAXI family TRAP transporter solute-binding subunit [Vicinamibacterales bacterium]|tara:strand:- start:2219 stop:3247 length:1029 start_codon:yes stop_codon:yes gene_type:complete
MGAVAIFAAVGCERAAPEPRPDGLPESLFWGVRATQGTTYVMDLALLRTWEEELGIKCFTTQVASSVAAFPHLQSGRLHVWQSGIRDAYLANHGSAEYEDADFDIRIFFKTADVHLAFVVLPDSGIERMEDLAGRTITYTSKRAVTMTEAGTALLDFYGIGDQVRDIPNLSMREKHAALIEGRVDASLEGLPNVDVIWRDEPGARPLDLSNEATAYVQQRYPWFWGETASPDWRMYKENYRGVGPGFDYPRHAATTQVATFVDVSADEKLVYTLLETMYARFDSLLEIHPYFRDYAVDRIASETVSVPYHAGTVRYLKDVGVWTDAMEANQQRLLGELGATR